MLATGHVPWLQGLARRQEGAEGKEISWFPVFIPPPLFSFPVDTLGPEQINPMPLMCEAGTTFALLMMCLRVRWLFLGHTAKQKRGWD